jgi:hypothetical protein
VPHLKRLLPLAALVLLLTGCAGIRDASVAQPGDIGRVLSTTTTFCTQNIPGSPGPPVCAPGTRDQSGQLMAVYDVSEGATLPTTFDAPATAGGGAPVTFHRDDTVAAAFTAQNGAAPAGTERIGYLSSLMAESGTEERDWTADAPLALPARAHAGTADPTAPSVQVYGGWRVVDDTHPADRPVDCNETPLSGPSGPPTDPAISCESTPHGPGSVGINDLAVGTPDTQTVQAGKDATLTFPLSFGSTATAQPTFTLAAGSTLPGATFDIAHPDYDPGAVDPTTHMAAPASRTVKVHVPANAAGGDYPVELAATTPAHGTETGSATLHVTALPVVPPAPPVTPAPPAGPRPVLVIPSHVGWKTASRKGVLARVILPTAGSRVVLQMLSPKSHGKRRVLVSRTRVVKQAGVLRLRLKLSRKRALALANRGLLQVVRATVTTPDGRTTRLSKEFPIL